MTQLTLGLPETLSPRPREAPARAPQRPLLQAVMHHADAAILIDDSTIQEWRAVAPLVVMALREIGYTAELHRADDGAVTIEQDCPGTTDADQARAVAKAARLAGAQRVAGVFLAMESQLRGGAS